MNYQREYINSKIECPVCRIDYARNYLVVHLKKQHKNIYNTPEWTDSFYAKNWENIKKKHKKRWEKNPPN